ncbi:MAG: hypothetical protein AMDU4_FER2C00206G0002 [Ferroplasma sp. Type II]|nr:MAG: hypothetical protein AMDU4_FER2C00206G0002 [Ferroplasma sp. Type II]
MVMENLNKILYLLIFSRGRSMKDNEPVPTKTHLQKEIFLLQKIYPFDEKTEKYDFVPLYYGPFSKKLSMDLDSGINAGLITDNSGIMLTVHGFKYVSELWNSTDNDEKRKIIQVKEKFNRMNIQDLIGYIYDKYPKFTKKSALKKENIDQYFNQFWRENELSDEYFVRIVRESRENNA